MRDALPAGKAEAVKLTAAGEGSLTSLVAVVIKGPRGVMSSLDGATLNRCAVGWS